MKDEKRLKLVLNLLQIASRLTNEARREVLAILAKAQSQKPAKAGKQV